MVDLSCMMRTTMRKMMRIMMRTTMRRITRNSMSILRSSGLSWS